MNKGYSFARTHFYGLIILSAACLGGSFASAGNWDGDAPFNGGVTYFDWSSGLNFYGNTYPTWNSATPLYFSYNNSGHSTLNQNIGWVSVQSVIYEGTFSGNTTVQGSDGFDLYWKIENLSSGSHTINNPISVKGATFEANPISGNLTLGGTVFNDNNRTLNVYGSNGHTLTLNSALGGSGGLTVNQNSLVVLNGAQTYSGNTTISAGEVRLGAANRIGDSSAVSVASGAKLSLNNFNETVASLSLSSGGTVALGTGQLIVNSAAGVWAGTITGSGGGSVVKKGSGTISVTGNNTGMAGDWYVVAGTAGFNHNNAAGSGTIHLGETGGSDSATLDSSVNGVNLGNDIVVRAGSSGTKTINQAVGSGTVTLSGGVTLNDSLLVTAGSGETMIFSGGISGGAGNNFLKQQDGTVRLTAASGYAGYTFIDQGVLSIGSGGDITASSGIDLGSAVFNPGGGAGTASATLDMQSGAADLDRAIAVKGGSGARAITTAGNNSISGSILLEKDLTVTSGSGTLTLGAVNLASSGNNDLNINGSGNTTIGGTIGAPSGASDINKSGAGTLTISGNNAGSSYKLNMLGGTARLNHASALGTAYSDKINFTGSSSELQVSATMAPAGLGMTINGVTATINVDPSVTFTVAGAIANGGSAGSWTKTGSGTMAVSGTSTYTGSTAVNGGTLRVTGSIASSSGVSVNNSGTLTGGGNWGALTVASGGTISPGNSPGTAAAGNTTWGGAGTYLWEINDFAGTYGNDPGWDRLQITGNLNITANSGNPFVIDIRSLTLGNAPGSASGFLTTDDYTLAIADYSGTLSGFSANAFTISTANFSNPFGGTWNIQHNVGGKRIELVYTGAELSESAIPEPGSLGLLFSASLVIFGLRRRLLR